MARPPHTGVTVTEPSSLSASLGPHIQYTNTNEPDEQKKKKVLSEFTILCLAALTAVLGGSLDTPFFSFIFFPLHYLLGLTF